MSDSSASANENAAAAAVRRLARALQPLSPAQMACLSDEIGVPRTIGARARKGCPINASAYLRLCSAIEIDPATGGTRSTRGFAHGEIVWWFFACGVFLARALRKLDIRAAAAAAGVSSATFCRAENGRPISIESYLKLTQFIGVPADGYVGFTGNMHCNTLPSNEIAQKVAQSWARL